MCGQRAPRLASSTLQSSALLISLTDTPQTSGGSGARSTNPVYQRVEMRCREACWDRLPLIFQSLVPVTDECAGQVGPHSNVGALDGKVVVDVGAIASVELSPFLMGSCLASSEPRKGLAVLWFVPLCSE